MQVHARRGRLRSSYDDAIFIVDDFLINGIQALEHQWKKCVNGLVDQVTHTNFERPLNAV